MACTPSIPWTKWAGWGLWMTRTATAGSVRIVQPLQALYLGLIFPDDGNFLHLVRGEPSPSWRSLNRMPSWAAPFENFWG